MSTRAVVYARISSDPDGLEAGVGRQQRDAEALCERRGWTIVGTYVDNDSSASRYSRKARPAYQQMLDAIAEGQVDAVAAYHTDRLYRQPKELEHLIDLVEAKGLLVGTCEGDFDLATSDGCMVARFLVASAAKSSDDKSRRIKRAKQEQAEKGGYSGGKRCFGMERDGVTIRPVEADLIREAARRIVAGDSVLSVCREWNERGVPTVMGGHWRATTLNRMLLSPRLIGVRTHKGVETPAVWPAILEVGTWQRVKAILTDPARNKRGSNPRKYLLNGLIFCAECNVKMWSHSTRYECMRDQGGCNGCGINAARIEADVIAAVRKVAESSKVRDQLIARASDTDEAKLHEQIAESEAELTLLAGDLAERRLGRAGYLAAVGAIEHRLESLRADLAAHLRTAGVVASIDTPGEEWDEMGFDRQRAVLRALIERIDVTPSFRRAGVYDPTRAEVIWRQ